MTRRPSVLLTALDLWCAQQQGEAGLRRRRERRLADLIRHARVHSPFYQRLYKDLPANNVALHDLQPVTKRQLMAEFDDWVTDRSITRTDVEAFIADPERIGIQYRDELFACTSSGTTGYPGLFLHDRQALAVYRAIVLVRIDLAWMNVRWLQMAYRGLRWASLLGTGGHFAGAGWVELERHRSAWKSRNYRVFSVQRPLDELVKELNAFDPTIIAAYPSVLDLLAEEQGAGRLHLRPILIEIAGESATPEANARMEAAFDCGIHNTYGASEFMFFAMSCEHGWLHVCSDWIIVEPVNEDLSPTSPGEPSYTVLITNLANRIQPIIRYDLGDSVVARPGPCPCGNHLPAIRVAGRCDDVLRLHASDGRAVKVLPLAIGSVVDEVAGVRRSQFIQTAPTTIELRLDPEPGMDVEKLSYNLIAHLNAYLASLGLSNVEIIRSSEPPQQSARSGKFRQVIAARK